MSRQQPPHASGSPIEPRDDRVPELGIDEVAVTMALVILALLVVGLFWLLPAWFGAGVINVTTR